MYLPSIALRFNKTAIELFDALSVISVEGMLDMITFLLVLLIYCLVLLAAAVVGAALRLHYLKRHQRVDDSDNNENTTERHENREQ